MKKMKHVWSDTLFADYNSTFTLNTADGCFCQSDIFLKRYLCVVKLILVDLHFLQNLKWADVQNSIKRFLYYNACFES